MIRAGAILAAGGSRRLGRPKQLVFHEGESLVRRAARTTLASTCSPIAIVVGAHADEIVPTLADLAIAVLENTNWRDGMASSIVCATGWAIALGADSLTIALVDQPRLTSAHLNALAATNADVAASLYAGRRGAPAMFSRSHFPELLTLRGDRGAGALLQRAGVASVTWEDGAFDVDDEADVRALTV